jgi:hypothetical protein
LAAIFESELGRGSRFFANLPVKIIDVITTDAAVDPDDDLVVGKDSSSGRGQGLRARSEFLPQAWTTF